MRFFLLATICLFTEAQAFVLPDVYKSGVEVCTEHAAERSEEHFKWISVPVDYNRPEKGMTSLYAYTKKAFQSKLPTVLFFTGGPGVSSRSTEFSLPETNVLFFEQRGISCSRPASKDLFLDPAFYSSENTARDALAVLKAWNLSTVSVYGHSYGTIPATIFASFFPSQTTSLILEGVVYNADKSLWLTKTRDQLLQNVFESLNPEEQNRILELSESGKVPPSWFSKIGQMMLYLNHGTEAYKTFLHGILGGDMDLPSFINNFFSDPFKPEEDYGYGDVTMGMIACREMSMSDPAMSLTTIFKNKVLVSDHNNIDRAAYCKPLQLENAYRETKPFLAARYPVEAPVYYLLGETDGATPLEHGLAHYENVARGKKQALIMTAGGHLPSLGLLKDNRDCEGDDCEGLRQNKLQAVLFEQLIRNRPVNEALIHEFNSAGELKWNIHQ